MTLLPLLAKSVSRKRVERAIPLALSPSSAGLEKNKEDDIVRAVIHTLRLSSIILIELQG